MAKEQPGWSPQAEVFNRLLADRIILLGTEIDDAVGNTVIAQLLYLEMRRWRPSISAFLLAGTLRRVLQSRR